MTPRAPTALGEISRRRRALAALSMRQSAGMAGIVNPCLSQIERGPWAHSDPVLDSVLLAFVHGEINFGALTG